MLNSPKTILIDCDFSYIYGRKQSYLKDNVNVIFILKSILNFYCTFLEILSESVEIT